MAFMDWLLPNRQVGKATQTTSTPITPGQMAQARLQQVNPQDVQASYDAAGVQGMTPQTPMGPGMPIRPFDGYGRAPRAFDYPVGVNIVARPRLHERTSFSALKGLVEAYDIAQMCVTHRIDSLRSVPWRISPMDDTVGDVDAEIREATRIMRKPDGVLPFRAWVSKYLWDVLVYDAGTLYKIPNMAGRPIGLQVIDGTTIAPLIDGYGNQPTGDAPAFVQYVKGVPWNWLYSDELIYVPFRPMPDSVYGRSPLEAVLLNASLDLRFQQYFMDRFTAGTIPGGFASAPKGASADQISTLQEKFDALIYGDPEKRNQLLWVPADTKFEWPIQEKFDKDMAMFFAQKTMAAYHETPAELGFTQDVNRATGESQSDVQNRIGDIPIGQHVSDILTGFLQDDLGLPVKFEFEFAGEEEDILATAQSDQIYIEAGVVSVSKIAQMRFGITDEHEIPRFVAARGIVTPLANIVAASTKVADDTGAPTDTLPAVQPKVEALPAPTSAAPSPAPAEVTPVAMSAGEPVRAELAAFLRYKRNRVAKGSWRDFRFEHTAPSLAKTLNDEGRREVDGHPFEGGHVVKAWRDNASTQPQSEKDLELVDYYTPLLVDALRAWLAGVDVASVPVAKADEEPSDTDTGSIDLVFNELVADSWGIGVVAAGRQLSAVGVSPVFESNINWDSWKPGAPDAAQYGDGLKSLLDGAGVRIKGFTDTLTNRLGQLVASAVANGQSVASAASDIKDQLDTEISGWRAEMIAQTEIARAMTASALDTFSQGGVTGFQWAYAAGACAFCLSHGDQVYPTSDTADAPPGHPRCRCAATPVVD